MRVPALLLVVLVAMAAMAAACGGSKSDPNNNQGQAGLAAAEFFRQERDGGLLPEGTRVDTVGTQTIKALAVTSEQKNRSVKSRYCVQFRYSLKDTPFTRVNRVYIASYVGGSWSVEAVKPDGNCDDVV